MNRAVLPDLAATLRTLGTYGQRLDPAAATDEQLRIVADAIEAARSLLATARNSQTGTGCARHPRGPVDPADDGRCLLCRPRRSNAPTAAAAALEVVARDIADIGPHEASQLHGIRAVALAMARTGRVSHPHPRAAHRESPIGTRSRAAAAPRA